MKFLLTVVYISICLGRCMFKGRMSLLQNFCQHVKYLETDNANWNILLNSENINHIPQPHKTGKNSKMVIHGDRQCCDYVINITYFSNITNYLISLVILFLVTYAVTH